MRSTSSTGRSRPGCCFRNRYWVVLSALAGLAAPVTAQLGQQVRVEQVAYDLTSGPKDNNAADNATLFGHTVQFADAVWLRFELVNVVLGKGDSLRLAAPDGLEQIITADDPQFSDAAYE